VEKNWAAGPMPNTSIIGILEKWAAFRKTNQLGQVLFN